VKILHIIDSGGLYGAEMVVLNLVGEHVKMGLRAAIASIGARGIAEKPFETEALRRGLTVVKFRMLQGPNAFGMFRVLRHAQKHGFEILHSHGYKGNVALGPIPRCIRRIPLVSTLHGYTHARGFSRNHLYEWLDLRVLRTLDAVVLVSRGMLNNTRLGSLKTVKFHLIQNGIPFPPSPSPIGLNDSPFSLAHEIVNFCGRGFTVGAIGRLSREKGYDHLITAVHLLLERGMDVRLVIMGEGEERPSLERLVDQWRMRDRVLLTGYVQNAREYLSLFSLFTISSLTEGLPITLIEAMAAELPVVATRVGGIPEVLQEGRLGTIIPPESPESLVAAILRVCTDPASAREVGRKAGMEARTLYSSERMAREYLELYLSVLNPPGEVSRAKIPFLDRACRT